MTNGLTEIGHARSAVGRVVPYADSRHWTLLASCTHNAGEVEVGATVRIHGGAFKVDYSVNS